ncbi:hypothetical protein RvY_09381 [Ramazzottius varieornatus]|uniref:Uncharacterized protein n=1 Tax=Ramazzottius varieornatus TaxID=947166 RepID=A0A1D1VH30_RAMVA|nr:hypothetical protein RvY_09381 [Ramazzottius varieornatus]
MTMKGWNRSAVDQHSSREPVTNDVLRKLKDLLRDSSEFSRQAHVMVSMYFFAFMRVTEFTHVDGACGLTIGNIAATNPPKAQRVPLVISGHQVQITQFSDGCCYYGLSLWSTYRPSSSAWKMEE